MKYDPDAVQAAKNQFKLLGFGDDFGLYTNEQATAYLDWRNSNKGGRTDVIPMDQELSYIATLLGRASSKFGDTVNGS